MRNKMYRDGSKMEFVYRAAKHMDVGQVNSIAYDDIADKGLSVERFRACLGRVGEDFGMKFRTCSYFDEVLHIKRVE